jgi:hypothetical protein
MSTIKISNLYPTGFELFQDAENFLNALADEQVNLTNGGKFITCPVITIPTHPTRLVSATGSVFIRVPSKPITKDVAKRVAQKNVEYSAASIVVNGVYDQGKKDN